MRNVPNPRRGGQKNKANPSRGNKPHPHKQDNITQTRRKKKIKRKLRL